MNTADGTTDFSTEDLQSLQTTVECFAKQAIAPQVPAWEEAGQFDRSLYTQAAHLGLLGLGYPEHLGGTPAPWRARNMLSQTLARYGGSGGVMASLFSHNIGLPPVMAHGSTELQAEVVPPVLRGESIAALAITEPGGGSDVGHLRTTAVRDGDHFVVNGSKTYITSAVRGDYVVAAVRTGGPGAAGISMLVIEKGTPGFEVSRKLAKMGWRSSDTAELSFSDARVPVETLVGAENSGFFQISIFSFFIYFFCNWSAATSFSSHCFFSSHWSFSTHCFFHSNVLYIYNIYIIGAIS